MTRQLADYVSQHLTVWSVAKITVFKILKEPLTFVNKLCVCSPFSLVSFNEALSHILHHLDARLGGAKTVAVFSIAIGGEFESFI